MTGEPGRTTYEVTFPADLAEPAAQRLFVSLSGLFNPRRPSGGPRTRSTLALELLATSTGVHHLLSFPTPLAHTIRSHLHATIPHVGITDVQPSQHAWAEAVELSATAGVQVDLDTRIIPVLLGTLTDVHQDEAVMVQFIVLPVYNATASSDLAYSAVGRLAVAAEENRARQLIEQALIAFRSLNVFTFRRLPPRLMPVIEQRRGPLTQWPLLLSPEQLVTAWGMPIGSPQIPGLRLGHSRRLAPDPGIPSAGRVLAEANFLGAERPLALSPTDRTRHLYIVGPTGSGKSTLMERMAAADIQEGLGVAYFDPKAESVDRLLDAVPRHRLRDVILLDVSDMEHSVGFNVLAGDNPYTTADQVLTTFDRLFDLSSSTPRAIDVLRSTLLSLAMHGMTLLEVPLALEAGQRGQQFRAHLVREITNPELLNFWRWFDSQLSAREQAEVAAPILRRLRPLLLYPQLRAMLGQASTGFDIRQALEAGKLLLVPLNRGVIGDEMARLLGSIVMTKLWAAVQAGALSREYYLYADEFQDVMNVAVSFGALFAQARGYRLGVTVAHQHPSQLPDGLLRDVFANIRSKVVFQTTAARDARVLAAELGPTIEDHDVMNLGPYEVLMRLNVDSHVTQATSAVAYPPLPAIGLGEAARAASRTTYGRTHTEVETEIQARHGGPGLPVAPGSQRPGRPAAGKHQLVHPVPEEEVTGWEPWGDDS